MLLVIRAQKQHNLDKNRWFLPFFAATLPEIWNLNVLALYAPFFIIFRYQTLLCQGTFKSHNATDFSHSTVTQCKPKNPWLNHIVLIPAVSRTLIYNWDFSRKKGTQTKYPHKNPVRGRLRISQRLRIVAKIPKRTETAKNRKLNKWKISSVTCHLSGVRCNLSHVTCHVSGVACRVSRVTCH